MLDHKFIKKIRCYFASKGIRLNPAVESDCQRIFTWRNHELNRRYSLNTNEIDWETHQKWYGEKVSSDTVKILIASYLGKEIGVIIFNFEKAAPEISIYLIPDNHGQGYGLSILYAANKWLKLHKINQAVSARILPSNLASISVFKDAGYRFVRTEDNYEIWEYKV